MGRRRFARPHITQSACDVIGVFERVVNGSGDAGQLVDCVAQALDIDAVCGPSATAERAVATPLL